MCVLCVAEYSEKRLNIAWHLMESIKSSVMHVAVCTRTTWVAVAHPFPVVSPGPGAVEGSTTKALASTAMGWVWFVEFKPFRSGSWMRN